MTERRLIICADCGKERPHRGRGLCTACYGRHNRKGTLGRWPLTVRSAPELSPISAGITYRQLDYWTRRGYLHAVNPTPGTGRRRRWSEGEKQVAAMMLRLISAGLTVEVASIVARSGDRLHELASDIWIVIGPWITVDPDQGVTPPLP